MAAVGSAGGDATLADTLRLHVRREQREGNDGVGELAAVALDAVQRCDGSSDAASCSPLAALDCMATQLRGGRYEHAMARVGAAVRTVATASTAAEGSFCVASLQRILGLPTMSEFADENDAEEAVQLPQVLVTAVCTLVGLALTSSGSPASAELASLLFSQALMSDDCGAGELHWAPTAPCLLAAHVCVGAARCAAVRGDAHTARNILQGLADDLSRRGFALDAAANAAGSIAGGESGLGELHSPLPPRVFFRLHAHVISVLRSFDNC